MTLKNIINAKSYIYIYIQKQLSPVPQDVGPQPRERDEHGFLCPNGPAALPGTRVDPHVEQRTRFAARKRERLVGVDGSFDTLFVLTWRLFKLFSVYKGGGGGGGAGLREENIVLPH